jgi:hypothetical protein
MRGHNQEEGAMSAVRIGTQFVAIVLTALVLVPLGAHLFELPNKIGLAAEPYFVVQNIYRGWALFGVAMVAALAANLAAAYLLRGRGAPFALALAAAGGIAATLVVFVIWTLPANVATDNWTTVPADWEALRRQWEYSHAANAAIAFAALCAATLSALLARD